MIHGDPETGVTTMLMAEGLDTGDMLLTLKTPIGEEETYGELHDRLMHIGAQALSQTVAGLADGTITPVKPDGRLATYAPMLDKKIAELDFTRPARELHNLIRGLSPWPVALTHLDGKLLKVHKAAVAEGYSGEPEPPGLQADDCRLWGRGFGIPHRPAGRGQADGCLGVPAGPPSGSRPPVGVATKGFIVR